MTLEEVFPFIEAKGAGNRSAGHLLESKRADATHSQYHRGKQEDINNNKIHNKNEICYYCRKQGMVRLVPTTVVPTTSRLYAVIHLEIGSSESRDPHSQKPVSPPDKRVSPM